MKIQEAVVQLQKKKEQRQVQEIMARIRNQQFVEADRAKKLYLSHKREILKKEREELEIDLKNQVIRKCRVANYLATIKAYQAIRLAAAMIAHKKYKIYLK